ncbi:hypothetical protein GCM10025865_06630 [Paraoerskovia sediminicola]|uniref:AEC family transporter n=1 Tax=Paraoerskovia sediminicola TaxID=1138587 RepID=A0ABM8FZV7_9CELL|nr:AEC family transporter [Paraoerskovia sediminicola]BDZ41364.1 hypothetical protein GCM10025865_06630 [Paraoerskovia sediminicola]
MTDVLAALATMAVVIAAGWVLRVRGVLGDDSARVLATVCFSVAGPCLLFSTVARADLGRLASGGAVVTWATTLALAAVLAAICRWGLRLPPGRAAITTLAGSYVNAGNLGIPLAVYLFGDALVVVPTMLVQLLLLAPLAFVALDRAGGPQGPSGPGVGRRRSPLRTAVTNPITVGTLLGLAVAAVPWTPPDVLLAPVELLGSAAPRSRS